MLFYFFAVSEVGQRNPRIPETIGETKTTILQSWLIQVHSQFNLLQETLYLTVAILDRFLQVSITLLNIFRKFLLILKTI